MDDVALRAWLAEPRSAIAEAVAEGARGHVAAIRDRGEEFYGYALLPGEPYDIGDLVAVSNGRDDIKAPESDARYGYFKYCVDEWARWERGQFESANALLAEANALFASLHTKEDADDLAMDEFELRHSESLLDAIVLGLELARDRGVFGDGRTFLAVWISDSGHPILFESVRRLNDPEVNREFLAEFG